MHGIGDTTAEALAAYLAEPRNREIVAQAAGRGRRAHASRRPGRAAGRPSRGLSFVITGTLPTLSRKQATADHRGGGRAGDGHASPGSTDFLVVGEDAGSKLTKARELGVAELDEAELLRRGADPPRTELSREPRAMTQSPTEAPCSASPPPRCVALHRALSRDRSRRARRPRWRASWASSRGRRLPPGAGAVAGAAASRRCRRSARGALLARPRRRFFADLGWGRLDLERAAPRRGRALQRRTGRRPTRTRARRSPPATSRRGSSPTSSGAWPAPTWRCWRWSAARAGDARVPLPVRAAPRRCCAPSGSAIARRRLAAGRAGRPRVSAIPASGPGAAG